MYESRSYSKNLLVVDIGVDAFILGSTDLTDRQIDRLLYPWELRPLRRATLSIALFGLLAAGAIYLAVSFDWLWLLAVIAAPVLGYASAVRARRECRLAHTERPDAQIIPEDDICAMVLTNMYFSEVIQAELTEAEEPNNTGIVGTDYERKTSHYRSCSEFRQPFFDGCFRHTGEHPLDNVLLDCTIAEKHGQRSHYCQLDRIKIDQVSLRNADRVIASFYDDTLLMELCTNLSKDLSDTVRAALVAEIRRYALPYVQQLHDIRQTRIALRNQRAAEEGQAASDRQYREKKSAEALRDFNDAAVLRALGKSLPE